MKLETIIARQIKTLRKERGMTQADLAVETGLKTASLAAIEQGWRTPSIAMLSKIAKGLDCEPWVLLKLDSGE